MKLLNKQDSSVPTLSDDSGTPVTSNFAKLNNFFYDCFNHALPPLQDELQRCNPDSCPEELLCTVEEIEELLLTLKTDKSTGPDNVSPRMLKSTAHSIAPSMTKLFNLSIASGSNPQAWKLARIVPIHKSGNKALPSNYRPISILSVISKILVRHVHSMISNFVAEYSPITSCQWGFMPHRSTVSALCSITHNWLQALDDGNEVCSVFFDLHKAFDSVPHIHLLDKLATLHLDQRIITWIHSYLMDRSQIVVVGGEQSTSRPVISGVPQGSVLGPLLFIIYINDVASRISPYSRISMYADDIVLYRTIYAPTDYIVLQDDIMAISQWVDENYLTLHSGKCCVMFLSFPLPAP